MQIPPFGRDDSSWGILEFHPYPKLRGEGNSHRRAWSKEISQGAGGDAQLIKACDGLGLRAGRVQTEGGSVADIVDRGRKSRYVCHEVVAGIIAIEQIEEFDKRIYRPALTNYEGPADPQINLYVGSSAKLVETGLNSIYHSTIVQGIAHAVDIGRRSEGEGPGAFGLS